MPFKTELSPRATALLRHRLETKDKQVTPANIEAYRELAQRGDHVPGVGVYEWAGVSVPLDGCWLGTAV